MGERGEVASRSLQRPSLGGKKEPSQTARGRESPELGRPCHAGRARGEWASAPETHPLSPKMMTFKSVRFLADDMAANGPRRAAGGRREHGELSSSPLTGTKLLQSAADCTAA